MIDQLCLLADATVTVLEYLTGLPASSSPRLASKAHDDFFIEAKLGSKFEPLILTKALLYLKYSKVTYRTDQRQDLRALLQLKVR